MQSELDFDGLQEEGDSKTESQKPALPYFNEPKDDNERLLNLQYEYLQYGSSDAWDGLWKLSYKVALGMVRSMCAAKRLRLDCDEVQDKAVAACEYVLRRYKTRKGWHVKSSFMSVIKHGVVHALFYRSNADELVDFVDASAFELFLQKTAGGYNDWV